MTAAPLADPFATADQLFGPEPAPKVFGQVGGNGRYHMPLLPGENGTKSGGDWVPGGVMRVTNLASAISDQEALNIWEQEQAYIGLAMDHSLYEELRLLVDQARAEGVNFQRLDLHPDVRRKLTGTWRERDESLSGRAKWIAGANKARQAGINRHTAWEHFGQTGELIGTPDIQEQTRALDALLAEHHLERVPGLSERVVRNTEVRCAGRFDDVVRHLDTGELFMADQKNKTRRFWTYLEVDIQLAIYARSRHMLDGGAYVPGPFHHVNQRKGVVMVAPSDGAAPYLRRADLERGWSNALLARRIVDERAYGKSREREALAAWPGVD